MLFLGLLCGKMHAQHPLVYGNDTILLIANTEAVNAEERGVVYNYRIKQALSSGQLPSDSIVLRQGVDRSIKVFAQDSYLLELFVQDSALNGEAIDVIAMELRNVFSGEPTVAAVQVDEINEKSAMKLILQSLVFLGAILMCALIYYVFSKLYHWLRKRYLFHDSKKKLKGIKLRSFEVVNVEKQRLVFDVVLKVLRIVFTGLFIYLTIPIAFSLFPETSHLSGQLFAYLLKPLGKIGGGLMNFIPELINIALVLLIVNYLLRFFRYLTGEISEGKLKVNNFRAEWAKPTFQLVRVLVIFIAVLILLPIFSFAESSLFLGFLAFLGLALALGSGTSVANLIAGIQIAFMRPYSIGDYIKVGDTSGEVVDSNLIVTKLKTKYNEIVSIPNVEMLKFHTVNYSASNKDLGLIVYARVKVANGVDIDKVTDFLVETTLKTKGVMENPRPYAMKLGMEDGKIELQINAYVQEADKLFRIKSAIINNIYKESKEAQITFE